VLDDDEVVEAKLWLAELWPAEEVALEAGFSTVADVEEPESAGLDVGAAVGLGTV